MDVLSVIKENQIPTSNEKILLPAAIKRVKLDVGLSYSAPMSQQWLSKEEDLAVFGFEPNREAIACIFSPDNKKKQPFHGDVLENRHLGTRFFAIPVALSNRIEEKKDFYITTDDEGCSSFYPPSGIRFGVEKIVQVPVITLKSFLDYFPWGQFPHIEYLKIDAQGADLDILRGAEDYLDKIVYVTAESVVGDLYVGVKDNDEAAVDTYMKTHGFERVDHPNTEDPTYLNLRYVDIASSISIYQRG